MNIDVEQIIREYIDKTVHLSLATVRDNKPWVSEVHFGYDDDLNLYFVSLHSTRHCQEIADNPHVAGNIVKQHSIEEAPNGIYFEGEATKLEDPTQDQVDLYCNRLGRDKAELVEMLKDKNSRSMYKIAPYNWAIFGKFGLDKNQKHELLWGKK